MMEKNKLLINTIILSLGNIGTKVISFILIPLYTIWFTPEEYGEYDLAVSIIAFVMPVLSLQLEQAVFRYVYGKDNNPKQVISLSLSVTIPLYLLFAVFLTCFCSEAVDGVYIGLIVLGQGIYTMLKEYIRGIEKLQFYVLISFINCAGVFFLNIILLGCFSMGIAGYFISCIVANIVCIIIIVFVEKPMVWIRFTTTERILIKQMIIFSLPLIPNVIAFWIVNLSDRFMITYYMGTYENGLYGIACKIPTLITTFYSAFVVAWQQECIDLVKKNDYKKIEVIYSKILSFLFTLLVLVTSILPFVYEICIDIRYFDSICLVPVLLVGTVFLCLAQFMNGLLIAEKRTQSAGISTVISAIINIALNFLMLKKYGLIIAAVSTCIAYLVLFVLRMWLIRQTIAIKKIVMIVIYLGIEFAVGYIAVSDVGVIKYMSPLFALCLFFFANRKMIVPLLKKAMLFIKGRNNQSHIS